VNAARNIVVGYVLAATFAAAAVWLQGALSRLPEEEAAGGMAAFGDLVLFLAVFSVAAIHPTGQILKRLTGARVFWTVWPYTSVVLAITGLLASAEIVLPELVRADDYPSLEMAVPLRVLAAGPLFIGFLLSAFWAPGGRYRAILLGCAAAEVVGAGAAIGKWVLGMGS